MRLESREELLKVEQQLRDRGSYPAIVSREELDHLTSQDAIDRRFNAEMTRSLDRWLDMADGKLRGSVPCILNGGNDDIFEIDPILESAPSVTFAEGKVIDLAGSGFTMISMGYTNPTPWDTHREASEPELAARIDAIATQIPDMHRTIFNFHAPPYGTGLDEAPELDANMRPTHGGASMKPVGSTAVRDAILKYQPPLSVHGHIHESRGVAKVGRTLTVNPGSSYGDGVLQAALLDINPKNGKVKYVLVNG
jgi:Icc-related predicted phosphoesterase